MTAAGAIAFELAGGGDFDPFGQPFMGLLFWHLTGSFRIIEKVPLLQYAAKWGPKI
jgi:hypothetical protein